MNTNFRDSFDLSDDETVASEKDNLQKFYNQNSSRSYNTHESRMSLSKFYEQLRNFELSMKETMPIRHFREEQRRKSLSPSFVTLQKNLRQESTTFSFKIQVVRAELRIDLLEGLMTQVKIMKKSRRIKSREMLVGENNGKQITYKKQLSFLCFSGKEDYEVQFFFTKFIPSGKARNVVYEEAKGECILSAEDLIKLASQSHQKKQILKENVPVGMLYLDVREESVNNMQ